MTWLFKQKEEAPITINEKHQKQQKLEKLRIWKKIYKQIIEKIYKKIYKKIQKHIKGHINR